MSFVFVSHASEDKRALVRPLVEALLIEGETVWLDRPGSGDDAFGFTEQFISSQNIGHIRGGRQWPSDIQGALRGSGAVLGCLSTSLTAEREVLLNEFLVGDTLKKFVPCIVDEMPHEELHTLSAGLFDPSSMQALRVRPNLLSEAISRLRQDAVSPDDLPTPLREAWEQVRHLIGAIDRVRAVPRALRPRDVDRAYPVLRSIPIGPILKLEEVPPELVMALGTHVDSKEKQDALLSQSTELIAACERGSPDAPKMLIRAGALPSSGAVGSDVYWTKVIRHAGLIARRTVGSVVLTPIADWAFQRDGVGEIAHAFIESLRNPPHRTIPGDSA